MSDSVTEAIKDPLRNYNVSIQWGGGSFEFKYTMPDTFRSDLGLQIPSIVSLILLMMALLASIIIKQNEQMIDSVNSKVSERTKELEDFQAQLKTSHERYDLAIKGSSDGIWDWDIISNHVFYSNRFRELLGFKHHEFPNQFESWANTLHPSDKPLVMEAIDRHLKNNLPYQIEYRCKNKNGLYKWYLAKGEAIFNAENQPIRMAGSISDIDHQKLLEIELRKAKDTAESANQTKSRFLSQISHELRTPLNSIIGFSQILRKRKDLDANVLEYISIMYFSGKHLLELINEVLDLTKLEANRMSLITEDFDLRKMIQSICDLFIVACKEKGLQFNLDIADNIPKNIHSDLKHLRQILINLIGNAVKFTQKGFVNLHIKGVQVRDSIELTFSIEDSGPGISENDQEEIFKPFTQSQNTHQSGTGLGLSISSQLIELMGGVLNVKSEVGQGSVFYFSIKANVSNQNDLAKFPLKDSEIIGIDNKKTYQILVVDDIESNRFLIKTFLQPLGFEILEACNGQQALNLCAKSLPDLVFMDIIMPIMDGNESAENIRKSYQDKIKIISMTASINNIEEDLKTEYFDDHMSKPVIEDELFDILKKHLNIDYKYNLTSDQSTEKTNDIYNKIATWIKSIDKDISTSLQKAIEMQDYETIATNLSTLKVLEEHQNLYETLSKEVKQKNISFLLKLEEIIEVS